MVSQDDLQPLAVDTFTAARLLGICERTLYELRKSGQIKATRKNKNSVASPYLYRLADLEAYLKQGE